MKSVFTKVIFWSGVLVVVEFCISKILRLGWGFGVLGALAVFICWTVAICLEKLTESNRA